MVERLRSITIEVDTNKRTVTFYDAQEAVEWLVDQGYVVLADLADTMDDGGDAEHHP